MSKRRVKKKVGGGFEEWLSDRVNEGASLCEEIRCSGCDETFCDGELECECCGASIDEGDSFICTNAGHFCDRECAEQYWEDEVKESDAK